MIVLTVMGLLYNNINKRAGSNKTREEIVMKNVQFKGILAIIMIIALVIPLTACGGRNNTSQNVNDTDEPSDSQNVSQDSVKAEPFGKYDPGIEITAVRPIQDGIKFKEGQSLENNIWTKAYEDVLGVKIKYLWTTPEAQYDQKLNISIASNDLPDIMQVNASQLKSLVDDNRLEDLTQIYDAYTAPFTKDVLSGDGGNALKSCIFDEKLYALPNMSSGLGQSHVLWVRTDWLKKLKLPEPKTMDDVFKISEAFKSEDPDENGKPDTFGLGVNKDLWGFYAALEGFFNGYHAYPNVWIKDSSGKLVYGSVQPEIKTALSKLQELYKSGQIDGEFGVKDASKVNENVGSGKIGMFYGFFWNIGWLQDAKIKNPEMEWTPYPLPSIDSNPAKAQVPFAISKYYAVKKGVKNPEAAVKMLNLGLEKSFGKTAEPEKYNVDNDGNPIFDYVLLYGEPPRKNLDAHLNVVDALNSKDDSKLNQEEKNYYNNCTAFLGGDIKYWGSYKMYGPGGSLSVINGYSGNNQIMDDQYFGAPTETMGEKNATLSKLQLVTFTEIIMENKPIDEFDNYVANWKKLGGDKITKEVNDWMAKQK